MKKWIKGVALALCLVLTAGNMAAFAEASQKEEVVYATLNSAGGVDGVYVVNIFPGGEVADYGDYASVRMLNTEDEISYSDGEVRFTGSAPRVYYQGNMKNPQLPWLFEISYSLNGEEMTAQEIAGRSGHMEMRIGIYKNEQAQGEFYQSHALQITASLDTDRCTNIVAEGATEANVGSKRQLSYILLPGNEKEYVISADVTDFEMDALSINGIHMSLDVEITSDDFADEISDIRDAANELDDGAQELMDGAQELSDGLNELLEHNDELMDGADKIVDAILETANEELEKSRGDFEKLGIELQLLTRENYEEEIIRLQRELLENVEAYVYAQAERTLRKKVNSAAYDEVSSQVSAGAQAQVRQAVEAAVEQQVRAQVESAVYQQLRSQISAQMEAAIRAEIMAQLNPSTATPAPEATMEPAGEPTAEPGEQPTAESTAEPTAEPTEQATAAPTTEPETTGESAGEPTPQATVEPAAGATQAPAEERGEEKAEAQEADNVPQLIAWLFGSASAEEASVDELVAARMNSAEVQAQIDGAAQSQMATEAVQATIIAQTENQMQSAEIQATIEQNVQAQLGSSDYQANVDQAIEDQMQSSEVKKLISSEIAKQKKSRAYMNSVAQALEENGENGAAYRALADLQESLDDVMEFYDGLREYTDGVAEAADGSAELLDGAAEMKDGTLEFRTETLTIDARITSEADELIAERMGADVPLISFADARNGEIAGVQFVISTPAVSIEEEEDVQIEEEEEESFADKLKHLFTAQE